MYNEKELEYVKCNLCNSDATTFICSKDSLDVVKCNNCFLIYVNPRLNAKEREKHYSEDYFTNWLKEKDIHINKRFRKRIKTIKKYKTNPRILDVGCGAGFFLEVAKKEGWDIYGTEISEFASEYARCNLGLNVITGELQKIKFENEFFDVITLWHILEHIPYPLDFLSEILRIMKKDGILIIEVPNIGSYISSLVLEDWELLAPKEHLFYFTEDTLKKLLEKVGFKIFKIESYLWTSPFIIIYHILKRKIQKKMIHLFFSILTPLRFLKLPNFIRGDVIVVYAFKNLRFDEVK